MAFEPRRTEALLSLGHIPPERLPAIAWDALEAGFDGPTICQMAALVKPGGWETDRMLPKFLEEAKMTLLPRDVAVKRVAYDHDKDILKAGTEPFDCLHFFARLCYESDYPAFLLGLYSLDDEVVRGESIFGRPVTQVRQEALEELRELVRRYETEHHLQYAADS